jgi:hypothetical protein
MAFIKDIIGARGLDSRLSKYLMDERSAQVAENFLVRSGARKSRSSLARWLYTGTFSNALRLLSEKRNFIQIIDKDNTDLNGIKTLELKFRLHGEQGISGQDPIPLLVRRIYSATTDYSFKLELAQVSGSDQTYNPKITISSGGTSYTGTATTIVFDHHTWYSLAVSIDAAGDTIDFHVDGNTSPDETLSSLGGATQAVGAFIHSRTEITHGDIIVGADEALTEFADIDVDELRFWSTNRTGAKIGNFYDKELTALESGSANLLAYINFQTGTDNAQELSDLKGNTTLLGPGMPFQDANDRLVFNGATTHGELSTPTVGAGANDDNDIFYDPFLTEIRFIPEKAKRGFIAGELELIESSTKWTVQFNFRDSGGAVNTVVTAPEFIAASDFGTTEYTVAIRNDITNSEIELWIDGVNVAQTSYTTSAVATTLAGANGKNVGCDRTLAANFVAMRLNWIRRYGIDSTVTNDYLANKYDQELTDDEILAYAYGRVDMSTNSGAVTTWDITGYDTAWYTNLGGFPILTHLPLNYTTPQDRNSNMLSLITGAQTCAIQNMDSYATWIVNKQIKNKENYHLTYLRIRYNKTSWFNIGNDFEDGLLKAEPDMDNANKIIYGVKENNINLNNAVDALTNERFQPFFVCGTTKLYDRAPVRYMQHFINTDRTIDKLLVIIGTGFYEIDTSTKEIIEHNVGMLPNNDQYFVGDFLDGQLYLSDGKTKIHVYSYKNKLRVHKWGFAEFTEKYWPTYTILTDTSGLWPSSTAKYEYAIAMYNREIDQYSGMAPLDADGSYRSTGSIGATCLAIKLAQAAPKVGRRFVEGTELVILRTKDTDNSPDSELHVLDKIPYGSRGYVDYREDEADLGPLWPIELVGSGNINPPDGKFVVRHKDRIWVMKDNKAYFCRIGVELHGFTATAETYMFPSDHVITIEDSAEITGAISFNDLLFIFTASTIDVIIGDNLNNFGLRRVFEGVGLVAPRTLKKFKSSFSWLGEDDIYQYASNGSIVSIDNGEGKIKEYIKDNLDSTQLDSAFAIYNEKEQLFEVHAIHTNGDWVTILYDSISNEFTIATDIMASSATQIRDSNHQSIMYYGLARGFIVNQTGSAQNYQPTDAAVKTTVSSYNISTKILTVADTVSVVDAGLVGNALYIVKANDGSVIRGIVKAHDLTSGGTVLELEQVESVFGNAFAPASGDNVFVAPIFFRYKSPAISVQRDPRVKNDSFAKSGEFISDFTVQELVALTLLHHPAASDCDAYFKLYRESATSEDPITAVDMDEPESKMHLADTSRALFLEVEHYYLHESTAYELFGILLEQSISDSTQRS